MNNPGNVAQMNGREKRYNFTRRLKSLMNVLHRPVETATHCNHSPDHSENSQHDTLLYRIAYSLRGRAVISVCETHHGLGDADCVP